MSLIGISGFGGGSKSTLVCKLEAALDGVIVCLNDLSLHGAPDAERPGLLFQAPSRPTGKRGLPKP